MCRWDCNGLLLGPGRKLSYNVRALQAATDESALKAAALDIKLAADQRRIQPDHARLSHDRASRVGDLHATDG
jgi:hypothetical protein